jgi:hypothetical protein
MLSKPQEPAQKTKSAAQSFNDPDNEIQINAKLPFHLLEYIRDFQNHEALRTGNLHFSLKDALTSIIVTHRAQNPDVKPRPATIKAAEKKRARRK